MEKIWHNFIKNFTATCKTYKAQGKSITGSTDLFNILSCSNYSFIVMFEKVTLIGGNQCKNSIIIETNWRLAQTGPIPDLL